MPRKSLLILAAILCFLPPSTWAAEKPPIALVVDAKLEGPAAKALVDLEHAIKQRNTLTQAKTIPTDSPSIVVGIPGASRSVDALLQSQSLRLADKPESLCVRKLQNNNQNLLLIAGRDSRGLSYALLDVARSFELSPPSEDPFPPIVESNESPLLRVRAISIHPLNADLEAEWYFDEHFWQGYFQQLARNRYNNFTLTFSDQTNYLNPIYAYMVDVPGFSNVRVQGQNAADRQRNLKMLGRIAELARERGLDFTLAIWMQAPVPRYSGKVLVENLPEGLPLADYCSRGLSLILQACPAINGIQLRMNDEAGVPPEKQLEFYEPIFRAIGSCGRPMRLDLRYKGVQPETVSAARDAGLDVTISTKLWCEHFGLPYHPTEADSHYRDSRYSFGTMLAKPRLYHVVYQLWTVGSQRLLLWGDPQYAERFAHSCLLGDGEGFEVFAPLTDKGYGNAPGNWRIFADKSYEVGKWEYERYWYFYLVFGRAGYSGKVNREIIQREFRHRFGDAAEDVEAAYRSASQVIPLVTATQLPGASEWSWWPEMDTGGGIQEYMHTQPSDTGQFYAIRSWKRTPNWRWEEWDADIPGYTEDAVAGKLRGKTTPWQISRILMQAVVKTEFYLNRAKTKLGASPAPEFRGTELDLHVLAQLARYHAAKKQAATHLAFFELTGETGRLPAALEQSRNAVAAWEQIVRLTDGVYHDNLVFGVTPDSPRSKMGHHHSGHWRDRLDEVRADVTYLEQLIKQHTATGKKYREFPGETPFAPPWRAGEPLKHKPITDAYADTDLKITVRPTSGFDLRKVILHYRRLDQTAPWNHVLMQSIGDNRLQAVIPGKDITDRWDLQYYFEVLTDTRGRIWPDWEQEQPFYVVKVKPAPNNAQALRQRFNDVVQPFLKAHCLGCHGTEKQEGKLNLSEYSSLAAVTKGFRTWEIVLERVAAGDMPPEDAKSQPSKEQRQAMVDWIKAFRTYEAQRNAGDPGPVLAHRLSSAEYDYTIRDLTGVDIRPTREFPVDPANEAGFDNSGESLTMSPALLKKYLAAARLVADHLVLKPQGIDFAPHPVVTETDRDKYCVHRIIDFYRRQPTDLADYFLAAARFKHCAALGKPQGTLAEFATQQHVSAKYLATLWSALEQAKHEPGPLSELQQMWRKLPAPDKDQLAAVKQQCDEMRDFVNKRRQELQPKIPNMNAKGFANGSQPMVLWKNRQSMANRMRYAGTADSEQEVAALDAFCKIFPDAFYISERDRVFLDPNEQNKGRLLSAGFHLMVGYFRDDEPLYQLILDEAGQRELDNLWQELNFITSAPLRQYKDFIFFERAEGPRFIGEARFDFARSEDKDITSASKMARLAKVYLAKAKDLKPKDEAIQALRDYFASISADIRWVEQTRQAAEPGHLDALLAFAQRAYRRPLSAAERDDLLAFYRSIREQEGLSHEEALRDCVVSILASPYFCYRVDLPQTSTAKSSHEKIVPLSDYALASRLSYFLWSSMPDAELLAHAAAGDLHTREVLLQQTRRMLQDERIRGLAVEFGGNWLDFRRFEEHNSVDRERFKTFTNELREAMYEEPLRFLIDVARENRSVLDFLYARHTFVNPLLAQHYGLPISTTASDEWVRVDDADRYGRGGLLPMAVFLTKNSPGLRTSPVKRGYWVIRRLLGENVPPPPPTVPELPKDEAATGDLTLRQLLAKHRDHKSCAGCHERFDSIGLVFEGFGPIGERRTKDLGDRPVDTHAAFPGGSEGAGLDGLQTYLRHQRQEEFIDNLCRKLLSYALGRTLLLSDQSTLDEMRTRLKQDGYRFGSLVESIVNSPQFLNKRDPGYEP